MWVIVSGSWSASLSRENQRHERPDEHRHDRMVGESHAVTPLELFFDLDFVFALIQVTTLLADDLSWLGRLRGFAVLAVTWWAWVG
jgi:low temperature requirement protein LtrA